jgi:hypothetical protein
LRIRYKTEWEGNEQCNGGLTVILQLWTNEGNKSVDGEESNNRGSPEESSELAGGNTRRGEKSNLLREGFPNQGLSLR